MNFVITASANPVAIVFLMPLEEPVIIQQDYYQPSYYLGIRYIIADENLNNTSLLFPNHLITTIHIPPSVLPFTLQ